MTGANRPTLARQSEVVNNSAAGENSAGGVLPRLDHGHIAAIPRGSREDYRASRRPLLRHLMPCSGI
jgi:hypothetical protein